MLKSDGAALFCMGEEYMLLERKILKTISQSV